MKDRKLFINAIGYVYPGEIGVYLYSLRNGLEIISSRIRIEGNFAHLRRTRLQVIKKT